MKEISVGKCAEAGDKYNSMIRTMGEDQAWQNMVSLDMGIHLDLSPVSLYSSQITLYRSLHTC